MTRNSFYKITLAMTVGLLLAACAGQAPVTSPAATQPATAASQAEAPVATQPPAASEAPAATENPLVPAVPEGDQRPETPTPGQQLGPGALGEAAQAAVQQLQSMEWVLRSYRDEAGTVQTVPAGERGTLNFTPDQVNGSSFCNSYFAGYRIEGDNLAISQPGSTMMACQPPKMDLERIFIQRLGQSATFKLEGNQLILQDQGGQEILVFEAGAQGNPPPDDNVLARPIPPGLQPDALANALLRTGFTNAGAAQLKDGAYEEPGPAGSNSTNRVRLAPDLTVHGALPDGKPVAAVVTGSNMGGSGTFYELHLVGLLDNGQPVDLAYIFLGDRAKINSIKFVDDRLVLDMVVQGPNDPMCCPTQPQILNVTYQNGALVSEIQPDTVSATAPAAQAGPQATENNNAGVMELTPTPGLFYNRSKKLAFWIDYKK